jgi:hypothetical protein
VIDLAVQVSPEKVVAKILENEPDIVGFSAFMPMFKADTNVLQKAGPARPGDRHGRMRFHDVELLDHFTGSE